MSAVTITAHLKAWDAAAEDNLCQPAEELTPADGEVIQVPADDHWPTYFGGNSHKATATASPYEKAMKALATFEKHAAGVQDDQTFWIINALNNAAIKIKESR